MDKTEIKPVAGNSPVGKNKIEVTNPKQKEVLMSAGIAAAVLGVAGGAYALYAMDGEDGIVPPDPPVPTPPTPPIPIYTDAPLAVGVNDDMSFGEAFAAARAEVGPGGFFVWKGAAYNTYHAEEWAAMSPEDKAQFQASLTMPSVSDNPIIGEDIADGGEGVIIEENDEGNSQEGSVDQIVSEGQAGGSDIGLVTETGDVEPVIIEVALNDNGIIDGLLVDVDGDGIADAMLYDSDGNGVPDVYFIDSDGIPGLDIMVIDEFETGDLGNAIPISLEDQIVIEIDAPEIESPMVGNDIGHLADGGEVLPDMDNNFDVSDYDDPYLNV